MVSARVFAKMSSAPGEIRLVLSHVLGFIIALWTCGGQFDTPCLGRCRGALVRRSDTDHNGTRRLLSNTCQAPFGIHLTCGLGILFRRRKWPTLFRRRPCVHAALEQIDMPGSGCLDAVGDFVPTRCRAVVNGDSRNGARPAKAKRTAWMLKFCCCRVPAVFRVSINPNTNIVRTEQWGTYFSRCFSFWMAKLHSKPASRFGCPFISEFESRQFERIICCDAKMIATHAVALDE